MSTASYEVRADRVKNRLYITFTGFFADEIMAEACAKVESESKLLKPGFSVITDITKCKPATPKGAVTIHETQEYLARHGVGRVIRVTSPDNVIIKHQFQTRSEGLYRADTAGSVAEAEKILDKGK
jgi:hypothetical protein